MANRTRPLTKFPPTPPLADVDGNHIQNEILLRLPPGERELLFPKIDRPGLEEAACECYGIMQRQVEEWRGDSE